MAKKRKWTKAMCQRAHTKARIKERFGLDVNRDDLRNMVTQIKSGNAIFIERQSVRVSKFSVWLKGQWIPVVYDKNRGEIITVLLEEWIQ